LIVGHPWELPGRRGEFARFIRLRPPRLPGILMTVGHPVRRDKPAWRRRWKSSASKG